MPIQTPKQGSDTDRVEYGADLQRKREAPEASSPDRAPRQPAKPSRKDTGGRKSPDNRKNGVGDLPRKEKSPEREADSDKATADEETMRSEAVSPSAASEEQSNKIGFSQWLRIRWMLDEELPENEYYLRIAGKYRFAKYGVILIAILLLLGMMAIYSNDITVENFRYLLRDLNADHTKYTGIYETIYYDGGELDFAMYKGDLVVVRAGQTSIYGMNAGTVMNEVNDFYAPALLSGDKYFLVYDPCSTIGSYVIYNAFSPLHSQTLAYPIYDAAMSNVGIYALVTEGDKHRGVVEIYDDSFDLLTTVYKDKYVWDVALSADGSRLLILSSYDADGYWGSEIHLLDTKSFDTILQQSLSGILCYACSFTEDAGLMVLTERDYRYCPKDGNEFSVIPFEDEIPISWWFGEQYGAVMFNRTILGRDKIISVMKEGQVVGRYELEGQITYGKFEGNLLYLLTESQITRIDCETGEMLQAEIDTGCVAMVVVDEEHLLLCYNTFAVPTDPYTLFGIENPNAVTKGENNGADS